MSITSAIFSTAAASQAAATQEESNPGFFAETLAAATTKAETTASSAAAAPAPSPAAGKAQFVSGRLGIDLRDGRPDRVIFFDENGAKLTQANFDAPTILLVAERLGMSLEDLNGLADQLDAAGVKYKPYQYLGGTGSDHGLDLRDLAAGGLGSAYDWRVDNNLAAKGARTAESHAEFLAMAQRRGVVLNPEVTDGGGLKRENLAPQTGGDGSYRPYVVVQGGAAAWYASEAQAQNAAAQAYGTVINLTQNLGAPAQGLGEPVITDARTWRI